MGPTITGLVQDPLAVLFLENQLCMTKTSPSPPPWLTMFKDNPFYSFDTFSNCVNLVYLSLVQGSTSFGLTNKFYVRKFEVEKDELGPSTKSRVPNCY